MSVSSHLTPDPERRLRVIYGNIYNSLKWTDIKLGALTFFAMAELAVIKTAAPEGAYGSFALLALCAVLPAGVLGVSPFIETQRRLPLLEPGEKKQRPADSLISEYDIAGYSRLELTGFLDRYLGGGITATPYYEDIVGQIVAGARIAARKLRLFRGACALAGIAQLLLLLQFAARAL
ncbi:MAG TPA: hypothetical protein PKI19_06210 [Elusimicrobiales bacterium]|nr:hypothetical protein [Elusimicrobiales bacterium]